MILNTKIKSPLKIAALFAFATMPGQLLAQDSDESEDSPKWYEVEVIVFKSTSMSGLKNESWQTDKPIEAPKDLIDFLQTYRLVPGDPESENETDSANKEGEENLVERQSKVIDTNSALKKDTGNDKAQKSETLADGQLITEGQSVGNDSVESDQGIESDQEVELEKPFQLLEGEALQLNNEVKSLNRHPEYKVISHIAWRQPVLGASEAPHIRIAAGQDFSLEYNYQGEKRLSHFESLSNDAQAKEASIGTELIDSEIESEVISADNSGLSRNDLSKIDQQSDFKQEESADANSESLEFPIIQQIVPELWVPEIDGDIKIYVGKYLHVKTNLFLRRPDREEVDAIDLNIFDDKKLTSLTSGDSSRIANDSLFENDPLNELSSDRFTSDNILNNDSSLNEGLDSILGQNTVENANLSNINRISDQQFSWEIDEDFLTTESEKMYIEKLFNYPLRQSRRMRSKELHYFDHPLFGMLIIITPYEKETLDADLELEDAN